LSFAIILSKNLFDDALNDAKHKPLAILLNLGLQLTEHFWNAG